MTRLERQAEIENLLYSVKNEKEIPPDIISEILSLTDDPVADSLNQPAVKDGEEAIHMRMMDERDWRKRAAMAAMLISNSLE